MFAPNERSVSTRILDDNWSGFDTSKYSLMIQMSSTTLLRDREKFPCPAFAKGITGFVPLVWCTISATSILESIFAAWIASHSGEHASN